jgi:hypothetical protein
MSRLALPVATLSAVLVGMADGFRGESTSGNLALGTVTVPEHPEWGTLTGTMTAQSTAARTFTSPTNGALVTRVPGQPPMTDLFGSRRGTFTVLSGPCTLADDCHCVGRWPGGYSPNEDCEIAVSEPGGILGPCHVFAVAVGSDFLATPDGVKHCRGIIVDDCPAGMVLESGQTLRWHSDDSQQGTWNGNGLLPECAGGGWQICFA